MAVMSDESLKRFKLKKTTSTIATNNKNGLMLYIPTTIKQLLSLSKGEKMVFDVKSGNRVILRKLSKEEHELLNSDQPVSK